MVLSKFELAVVSVELVAPIAREGLAWTGATNGTKSILGCHDLKNQYGYVLGSLNMLLEVLFR